MKKSSKSIISHIPAFLDYCQKTGLSDYTQRNYKQYLEKFIYWLKKENKKDLKPHELTVGDILTYKLFLSQFKDNKGKPLLKKITQNYYLIALRALLSYFTAKDSQCIASDKVSLPKDAKKGKTVKFLSLEQIEKFLLAPNIGKESGLRDRAILETLIFSGLKISQLVSLNRDKVEILSKRSQPWVERYLKARKDKNKALFINYRSRKSADKRLTARSIERITNKYGRQIGLPFPITPEILRKSYALSLLEKQNKIKIIHKPQVHKTLIIKNYKCTAALSSKKIEKNLSPTWHLIESIINKEINWLKSKIPVMPEGYKNNPLFLSDDLILRKIAILIVSGKIKAIEFQAEKSKDLWNDLTKKLNLKKVSRHGKEWHKKMMNIIHEYFKLKNYKVVLEPVLNYGRADLGIYSNSKETLYVEVDTVSLYKLWHNLSSMKNVTFLIIPSEECIIELKV